MIVFIAIIAVVTIAYFIHKKSTAESDSSNSEQLLSERIPSTQDSASPAPTPQLKDFWEPDKLYTRRVRERLDRAKSEDITIGCRLSGTTYQVKSYDETYKTSLQSCTCADFSYKQTPCKHMLKLALEIGALNPDDQLFGVPEEIDQRYQSLNKASQKYFVSLCSSHGYRPFEKFIVKRTIELESLLQNGLVVENLDPEFLLKNAYTVSELRAILREYQNDAGVKVCTSSDSKQTIINNIIAEGDRCLSLFTSHNAVLEFDTEVAPFTTSLCDKYSK